MTFIDRFLTIIVTATITSAAWIVFGGSLLQLAGDREGEESVRPSEAAPSPSASESEASGDDGTANEAQSVTDTPSLDTDVASAPDAGVEATLMVPVLNVRRSDLTDTFSTPEPGQPGELHEALDIMAPEGTTVVSAAPGTIEKLFYSQAGGNTIYVRSSDRRTIHYYAHLDEYAEGLNEGQRIRRGQRLGTVGSSGNANEASPHLHFAILRTTADAEWWEPANAVNPYPLLTGG